MQATFANRIQWPPAGHYIVAVSGGVDSVTLLHLLASQQMQRGWRLRVAHVNHGWRADAGQDQKLVRDIARVYNLPFHSTTLALDKTTEDSARQARYAYLQHLIDTYSADAIVTAHHQNDQHETSWLQVARGSGRQGSAGLRSDKIVRPLLGVRKEELIGYARQLGLPWREDSTNTDTQLTRNFLRHEMLPLAREVMPEFEPKLDRTLQRLASINQQIDTKVASWIKISGDPGSRSVRLARSHTKSLSLPQLAEVVTVMIKALEPGLQLSQRLVKSLALLAKTGRIGQEHTISATMVALVDRKDFVITEVRESVQSLVAQDMFEEGSVRFGKHQLSYGSVCLDGDHPHIIPVEIKVRRVLPGDRIDPIGMSGTKKLQDLFVDAKIDRSQRAAWPVVARVSDNQVVWVPRLAVSRSMYHQTKSEAARCLTHQFL